jgi:Na+/proline symporter
VAKRLRLLAEVRQVYTVPDAFLCRFGCRRTSGLAALAVIAGSVAYLGAQLLALGRLIEAIFGTRQPLGEWSLPAAMAAGLAVVLLYSIAGGMIAGVYTDLFQGGLMILAAVTVFVQALRSAGGWGEMTASIASSPSFGESFLDPLAGAPFFTAIGFFFVFSIGCLGQPHMLHKFYMLDDIRKLKWMPLLIALSQTLCVFIWLGIGLAVPALVAQGKMPVLQHPDDAAPAFLLGFAPEILGGLVFAGILAAIMSTVDSFLNIGAAALVRDLPRAAGRALGDELLRGRIAVLAIALAAALVALSFSDLIALLGTLAFATFGAALAPALAIGLNWRRVTARAASASILTGLAVNLGLEFLTRQTLFPALPRPPFAEGVLPGAVALAASFAVLLLVSWLTRTPEPLDEDVAVVMEA